MRKIQRKNPLTYPHEGYRSTPLGVLDSLHASPIFTEPIVVDTCEVTLFDLNKQLDINDEHPTHTHSDDHEFSVALNLVLPLLSVGFFVLRPLKSAAIFKKYAVLL